MFSKIVLLIGITMLLLSTGFCLQLNNEEEYPVNIDSCKKPLILTPYVESDRIHKAQKLSRVHLPNNVDDNNTVSYSGYLTVNKSCNSNIFFWFFPSQNNYEKAPVTLWLQGGPGGSSLFGMFEEIGPFTVNGLNKVIKRDRTWNSISSLLFIDQPVGTGFSYTDNKDCLATTENDVRKDLYEALLQFFKLFPQLQSNDFFIFGESYAGKYIPAIAYSIHENNPNAEIKINLKGLGIGDGVSDRENMMVYSDYVYQLGLVDEVGKDKLHDMEQDAIKYIKSNNWKKAFDKHQDILNEIYDLSGGVDLYNYAKMGGKIFRPFQSYVSINMTRCAIHVGDKVNYVLVNGTVRDYLEEDRAKTVKPWIEILVEIYPILFFNGQFDIIAAYPLTRNFVNKLVWSGADEFKKSLRLPFYIGLDRKVCGYTKKYKNLQLAMIRNAGHMSPQDQPDCVFQLYKKFISH